MRSQTFSPFLLPTDLPPRVSLLSHPFPPPAPLSASPLSPPCAPRSPVTARRHVRVRTRNDPRVHRAPFATDRRCDVAWTHRDEIAKRVVAKLRYYAISSRFPAEARDLPSLFSRGNVRAHFSHYCCRNYESVSYIPPFFCFFFYIFLLFYEIHSFSFHAEELNNAINVSREKVPLFPEESNTLPVS